MTGRFAIYVLEMEMGGGSFLPWARLRGGDLPPRGGGVNQ